MSVYREQDHGAAEVTIYKISFGPSSLGRLGSLTSLLTGISGKKGDKSQLSEKEKACIFSLWREVLLKIGRRRGRIEYVVSRLHTHAGERTREGRGLVDKARVLLSEKGRGESSFPKRLARRRY